MKFLWEVESSVFVYFERAVLELYNYQFQGGSVLFSDPLAQSQQKALEAIGGNLQKQYERWQPRARYKQTLDPTVEEVKKLCTSLRRNAKVNTLQS